MPEEEEEEELRRQGGGRVGGQKKGGDPGGEGTNVKLFALRGSGRVPKVCIIAVECGDNS